MTARLDALRTLLPGASAEALLVLHGARVGMDAESAASIRELVQGAVDWQRVLRMARVHGVVPLLYPSLRGTCPDAVPAGILEQLHQEVHQCTLDNLRLAGELLRLLKQLTSSGISVIPYKGPTLAVRAYGSLALRQFNDLDLLIPPGQLSRARQCLRADGFELQPPLKAWQEAPYVRSTGQLPLVHAMRACLVELHTEIVPRRFLPIDTAPFWERLSTLSLAGQPVATLSPEDLLLILCIHGTKHLWRSLGWICDVAELLRAVPNLDFDRVEDRAQRLRAERMLLLGLALARNLLKGPVPERLARRVEQDVSLRPLLERVYQWLLHDEGPSEGLASSLFQVRLRPPAAALPYVLDLLLSPTEADWATVSLPASLGFLYYFLRPVRLAAKYGRRSLGWLVRAV